MTKYEQNILRDGMDIRIKSEHEISLIDVDPNPGFNEKMLELLGDTITLKQDYWENGSLHPDWIQLGEWTWHYCWLELLNHNVPITQPTSWA